MAVAPSGDYQSSLYLSLTDTSAMSALVSSGSKAYRLISNLRNVHTVMFAVVMYNVYQVYLI